MAGERHVRMAADASVLLSHDLEDTDARVARQPISFGDYVTANVFFPAAAAPAAAAAPPLPAVVWLHPYSYATGYTPAYGMSNVVEELVLAGYAVLAYDQAGFAARLREGGSHPATLCVPPCNPIAHLPRLVRRAAQTRGRDEHEAGDARGVLEGVGDRHVPG